MRKDQMKKLALFGQKALFRSQQPSQSIGCFPFKPVTYVQVQVQILTALKHPVMDVFLGRKNRLKRHATP